VPPRRKKVTTQTQTLAGEGGVAVIARRVNEMGYLWHDRRVGSRDLRRDRACRPGRHPAQTSWLGYRARHAAGPSHTRPPTASSGPHTGRTWIAGSAATPGDRGLVAAGGGPGLVVRRPRRVHRPPPPRRAHRHHQQAPAVLRRVSRCRDHAHRRAPRFWHLPGLTADEGGPDHQPAAGPGGTGTASGEPQRTTKAGRAPVAGSC